jgi:hypothetical protein
MYGKRFGSIDKEFKFFITKQKYYYALRNMGLDPGWINDVLATGEARSLQKRTSSTSKYEIS